MPLTDQQKAYLVFKEFVGLSDDVLLGGDEDFFGESNGTKTERFDNSPTEDRDQPSLQMSNVKDELKSIDPKDVNYAAVKEAGQKLSRIGDQKQFEHLVATYTNEVEDLFHDNTNLSYRDFEQSILRIFQKEYTFNKELCYRLIGTIAKGPLRTRFGTRFIWHFTELITRRFSSIGAKLYDEQAGTAI